MISLTFTELRSLLHNNKTLTREGNQQKKTGTKMFFVLMALNVEQAQFQIEEQWSAMFAFGMHAVSIFRVQCTCCVFMLYIWIVSVELFDRWMAVPKNTHKTLFTNNSRKNTIKLEGSLLVCSKIGVLLPQPFFFSVGWVAIRITSY